MRKALLLTRIATIVALSSACLAQSILDLPRPSQRAQVMQRIGLTAFQPATVALHRRDAIPGYG